MIAILDYGAGNLRSVETAFKRLGVTTSVTKDPDVISLADGVVLPGVGAFADAMNALHASGLVPVIHEVIQTGMPFLGICLGMQALFDSSDEGPGVAGLGIVPGMVHRLPDRGLKIPHIGWNSLQLHQPKSPLVRDLPDTPYAYFVHSFACMSDNPAHVLTTTEYGVSFHSAVQKDNVIGMQFHPEKSGKIGEILLRNFVKMCRGES